MVSYPCTRVNNASFAPCLGSVRAERKKMPDALCAACNQVKSHDAFSKKALKTFAPRCKSCSGPTCAECGQAKPELCFSRQQLARLLGHQTCRDCELAAVGTLRCRNCGADKPTTQFSKVARHAVQEGPLLPHLSSSCQSCTAKVASTRTPPAGGTTDVAPTKETRRSLKRSSLPNNVAPKRRPSPRVSLAEFECDVDL
jgi:hypothetical protein